MKDSEAVLYPNEHVARKVTEYSDNHTLALPKEITDYHTWICENREEANYCISTFQAKSHVWLARLIGAKRILEIGSFLGFSASVWSYAVGPDGIVTGLEFSEEYAATARSKLDGLGIKNVEFKVGPAADTLQTLTPTEPYDLVFIDADKPGYPTYLSLLLSRSTPGSSNRLLRPGALIVADNVLRRGLVAEPGEVNPHSAAEREMNLGAAGREAILDALRRFNDEMHENPRVESWLCPLWDGVMVGRLVD